LFAKNACIKLDLSIFAVKYLLYFTKVSGYTRVISIRTTRNHEANGDQKKTNLERKNTLSFSRLASILTWQDLKKLLHVTELL
jgi:hypothetical protein